MKKIMIVAALVASTFAYGACKDEGSSSAAAVYVWQFKGKTSVGVKISDAGGGACVDGGTCAIRVPGGLAITAYSYLCDYYCESFGTLIGGQPFQFFATKPWKSTLYTTEKGDTNPFATVWADHVIGKSATQYELGGEATFVFNHSADLAETFTLTYAGYGAFNKKTGIITSVSGYFAGKQSVPRFNGKLSSNSAACPVAGYWDCLTLAPLDGTGVDSVAYGSWSVKYNASYSKKLAANKNWRVK